MLQFTGWGPVYLQYPPMEVILHFLTDVNNKGLCTGVRNETEKN